MAVYPQMLDRWETDDVHPGWDFAPRMAVYPQMLDRWEMDDVQGFPDPCLHPVHTYRNGGLSTDVRQMGNR